MQTTDPSYSQHHASNAPMTSARVLIECCTA